MIKLLALRSAGCILLLSSVFAQALGASSNEVTLPTPNDTTIVFATSTANAEPLAELNGSQLTGGILKDLGDAIGVKLHRKVSYVALPRKRLEFEIGKGAVDGVCYYRPEWLTVALNWSPPMIPNEILLVIRAGVPRPAKLKEVEGKTIGTVIGYKYPELAELHEHYQREDAPTMVSNIKKLIAGRVDYAIIDRLSFEYYKKTEHEFGTASVFPIEKINASCGFSIASKIPIDQINVAIHELIEEGAVEKILAQYR